MFPASQEFLSAEMSYRREQLMKARPAPRPARRSRRSLSRKARPASQRKYWVRAA